MVRAGAGEIGSKIWSLPDYLGELTALRGGLLANEKKEKFVSNDNMLYSKVCSSSLPIFCVPKSFKEWQLKFKGV